MFKKIISTYSEKVKPLHIIKKEELKNVQRYSTHTQYPRKKIPTAFEVAMKRRRTLPKIIVKEGWTKGGYHLPSPSPWPVLTSFTALSVTVSIVSIFKGHDFCFDYFKLAILLVVFCAAGWWRDVIRESTFEGNHTSRVQLGIRLGIILFIVSEVMFFFSFFWAFFHSSISPAVEIGCIWPPKGIVLFDITGIPLCNTSLLITSGATLTWAHHAILSANYKEVKLGLILTIGLGCIFSGFQLYEYKNSAFSISDSIFGSVFYMGTGFHGFHVALGTAYLFVCLIRMMKQHFTKEHHLGFEGAAWYWHFVDVVWLLLFICFYWWGF